VWRALDELGDQQSYYLLEKFVPGDVFHVDALTVNGEIIFNSVQKYGAPPLHVYQGGGVFNSRILPHDSADTVALIAENKRVIKALGLVDGVTHGEFIKAHEDGQYYFLEIAARVGGAFLSDMIEQATNINLWREWARLEIGKLRGQAYVLPEVRGDYGGILVTLAKQQYPDLSAYNDPEVVWRVDKPYHAVLVVVSPDAARVEALVGQYVERFVQDFSTSAAAMGATRTGQTG